MVRPKQRKPLRFVVLKMACNDVFADEFPAAVAHTVGDQPLSGRGTVASENKLRAS